MSKREEEGVAKEKEDRLHGAELRKPKNTLLRGRVNEEWQDDGFAMLRRC